MTVQELIEALSRTPGIQPTDEVVVHYDGSYVADIEHVRACTEEEARDRRLLHAIIQVDS